MTRTGLREKGRIDMTAGPLFPSIIKFILPLIATNLLQQVYHAADIMVVGLSPEADAVGAVGATGSFLALMRNLFLGFSVGANVVVARCIGAKNKEKTACAVHTAVFMSLLLGILGAIVGILLTRPVLVGMGYTGTLLELGSRYAYIYLACLPFLSVTNFLAAILQAQGNPRVSLYTLSATGVLNIGLNLFFVLGLGWSVEGVATATAIANLVSACVLWGYLARRGGECRIRFRDLRLHRDSALEITRVGFPSAIQHSLFSISNLLIQSSILEVNNALTPPGSAYAPIVKGNTAAGSIESFIFEALAAVTVTASSFTAQNVGAGNAPRVRRAFGYICLISSVLAILFSALATLFCEPLLALYGVSRGEDLLSTLTVESALTRIRWKWPGFFIYSVMNAGAGTIRGLGRSSLAAVITFFGTCVFRIVWIFTAYAYFQNLESIHISYPLSWLLTGVCFLVFLPRLIKEIKPKTQE